MHAITINFAINLATMYIHTDVYHYVANDRIKIKVIAIAT